MHKYTGKYYSCYKPHGKRQCSCCLLLVMDPESTIKLFSGNNCGMMVDYGSIQNATICMCEEFICIKLILALRIGLIFTIFTC